MTQQHREPASSPHKIDRWREAEALLGRRDHLWAAQLVVAGAIALDLALPNKLAIGPFWLLPAIEATLLFGLVGASPHPRLRHSRWRRRIALGLIGFVSAANVVSLILLVTFCCTAGRSEATR